MTDMTMVTDVRAPMSGWAPTCEPAALARATVAFLDAASTAFGRATAYNTREEGQAAELAVHEALLRLDRGLYALLLTLPGVTDRARQVGVKNLLGVKGDTTIGADVERRVLSHLVAELPATRVFKLFVALRAGDEKAGIQRANNARTRKLILRVILGSSKVELWAVKYRTKMAEALTHAWGQRTTSILRSILGRSVETWSDKEQAIVRKALDRFARDVEKARACVAFVLRASVATSLPLLSAYEAAKTDLSLGKRLPLEVLEGIRSTFHKDVKKETVLALAKDSLTTGQKMQVQRRAAEAGVDVRMDVAEYDAVRLYLYAFEMGMTREILEALVAKARVTALQVRLRLGYGRIGILLDASASMTGSREQPLRPMATALALRDVLAHAAEATIVRAGGDGDGMLVRPSGATSLAEGLVELLVARVDAVFVLSDGYENGPAGRFAEVVAAVRAIGISTPIYHLNPVFAAESKGVRQLAQDGAVTLPVRAPEALGLGFVRGLLETDPARGLAQLADIALPQLLGKEA
ncbi:MAG: VWA domain-containing protein [Deltaproteobacteria bacterium]|nr:VWA domain-containing protein [Deltaproteobacteria bacterium]